MEQIIVFDLDFTLWNACGTWCDHTHPPYKRINNHVIDSCGGKIILYPDVIDILENLRQRKIEMALASRTGEPSWAKKLLHLFGISDYFKYQEIYPASKIEHFSRIQYLSKIPFDKMIFFDDEMRNIYEVQQLGVHSVFVDDGITSSIVEDALSSFE